jgi:O-antigen/teichoic acid export membrane protein
MLIVAFALNGAYLSQRHGDGVTPELATWLPVSSPILCIAMLLNVASRSPGTSFDRFGLRVAWGLLAAYALFIAGLLLLRPADGWWGLALAQGSLAVVACAIVCFVVIVLSRSVGSRARAADANRAAIHDWTNRS